MTFNFIGLWLAISLGAEMAKMYGLDQNIGSIVTVGRYGRVVTAHIRGEGDSMVDSVKEMIEIGRKGCFLLLS